MSLKSSCFLFLLLLSPIAAADVVSDPPEECPTGSQGTSSHSGTWCAERTCDDTEDCPEDSECLSTSVCLHVFETECGGIGSDTGEPCTFEVREVLGDCESDDDCERGSCVTADRCATESQVAAEAEDCGGCSQTQKAGSVAALMGLLGLMGLARRRA